MVESIPRTNVLNNKIKKLRLKFNGCVNIFEFKEKQA